MADTSPPMFECECMCDDNLGGISAGGWIVLMLFIGMVFGSMLGVVTTLWFAKRRDKHKLEAEAASNWRILSRPGTVSSTTGPQSAVGGNPATFTFAPMSLHKHKLLTGSNTFELQSVRTSQAPSAVPSHYNNNAQTPHSSVYTPTSFQGGGLHAHSSHALNNQHQFQQEGQLPNMPDSVQTRDDSFAKVSSRKVLLRNEDRSSSRSGRSSDKAGSSGLSGESSSSSELEGEIAVHTGRIEERPEGESVIVRKPTRTASGLDEDVLAQVQTAAVKKGVKSEYKVEELGDDWKEILGAVDRMLGVNGQGPLTRHERSTAMEVLLNASESDGVDTALENALHIVLERRGVQVAYS